MANCFVCLVNLPKKSNTFNIVKGNGAHTKTSYGDLIGKLLQDQKLVITISDDNHVCETCNTLINAFDYHIHEQNTIKQIISRQVSASYLKNKAIAIRIDEEALSTFEKHSDGYQCKQCYSFRTSKIEFATAHFKAHQCKWNASKTIVKDEVNDAEMDYTEMPIEEILLNSSACKYEDDRESANPDQLDANFETNCAEAAKKARRTYRISNDPVTNYTASTRLPRYLRNVLKITKTRTTVLPKCRPDNLFVIEVPQIETVGYHFTCKICLREFLHPLKLASHLLTHKEIKYSCNHCLFTVSKIL